MASYKSSGGFKPFGELKRWLPEVLPGSVWRPGNRKKETFTGNSTDGHNPWDAESDAALFQAAMADVTPIFRDGPHGERIGSGRTAPPFQDPDREAILKLKKLVDRGEGFVVSQTPEYMEGCGTGVHPRILKRLHRGDFSIQAHFDLHGYTVAAAKTAFDHFMNDSISRGRRVILIVHGRGLSSPSEPVLKTRVFSWLTSGPWRKWVLAFTSARLVDGGAGATTILLRKKPVTRAELKKSRSQKAES